MFRLSRSARRFSLVILCVLLTLGCGRESTPSSTPSTPSTGPTDALPSWNEGAAKKSIVDFVARVTREGGPDFVPPSERIATFDNDGTLWSEKPVPFQLLFAFDRVKALAAQHPEWKTREPFASLLRGDMAGVAASGEHGVLAIVAATHTGMTTDDFSTQMLQWAMAGTGARLALFVHHDDAAREFAYDRMDKLQQFNKAWDEAVAKGWTVVSMKDDWKTVFRPRLEGDREPASQSSIDRREADATVGRKTR